jgi:hypothetical protein
MSNRLHVFVEAVAVRGPGLADWESCARILDGLDPYCATPVALDPPAMLSAAERRRAVPSVRLALAVAAGAVARSGRDATSLPAVFASSGADGETIAAVLSALAAPGREVSPTRFHNSVHNAPSGYWGVGMQSREAVTSLSGHDASFAAGLLEACAQVVADERPVLLAAYDLPYPHPLACARRIAASFGVALVLSPTSSAHALAQWRVSLAAGGGETVCVDPELEHLRAGNPAARSLPLLTALAMRASADIRLAFAAGALEISTAPC